MICSFESFSCFYFRLIFKSFLASYLCLSSLFCCFLFELHDVKLAAKSGIICLYSWLYVYSCEHGNFLRLFHSHHHQHQPGLDHHASHKLLQILIYWIFLQMSSIIRWNIFYFFAKFSWYWLTKILLSYLAEKNGLEYMCFRVSLHICFGEDNIFSGHQDYHVYHD